MLAWQKNSQINKSFNDANLTQINLEQMSQRASNQIPLEHHILTNTAVLDCYLLLLWRKKSERKKARQQFIRSEDDNLSLYLPHFVNILGVILQPVEKLYIAITKSDPWDGSDFPATAWL